MLVPCSRGWTSAGRAWWRNYGEAAFEAAEPPTEVAEWAAVQDFHNRTRFDVGLTDKETGCWPVGAVRGFICSFVGWFETHPDIYPSPPQTARIWWDDDGETWAIDTAALEPFWWGREQTDPPTVAEVFAALKVGPARAALDEAGWYLEQYGFAQDTPPWLLLLAGVPSGALWGYEEEGYGDWTQDRIVSLESIDCDRALRAPGFYCRAELLIEGADTERAEYPGRLHLYRTEDGGWAARDAETW